MRNKQKFTNHEQLFSDILTIAFLAINLPFISRLIGFLINQFFPFPSPYNTELHFLLAGAIILAFLNRLSAAAHAIPKKIINYKSSVKNAKRFPAGCEKFNKSFGDVSELGFMVITCLLCYYPQIDSDYMISILYNNSKKLYKKASATYDEIFHPRTPMRKARFAYQRDWRLLIVAHIFANAQSVEALTIETVFKYAELPLDLLEKFDKIVADVFIEDLSCYSDIIYPFPQGASYSKKEY